MKLNDFIFNMFEIEVEVTMGNNPCLHIDKSYRVKKSKFIRYLLEYIHSFDEYKKLQAVGYNRTLKSEYREWKAHNFLYKLGIFRDRTGSVDIAQNESKWRKFAYAILSIF